MAEPNLADLFEATNLKLAEQIINKDLLEALIKETEELHWRMCTLPEKYQSWEKQVLWHNLRAFRQIKHALQYDQPS